MEPELLKSIREDPAMKSPFSKEIFIRLDDDESSFTCTKSQWFRSKVTTFSLHKKPSDNDADIGVPRVNRWPRTMLGLTDES